MSEMLSCPEPDAPARGVRLRGVFIGVLMSVLTVAMTQTLSVRQNAADVGGNGAARADLSAVRVRSACRAAPEPSSQPLCADPWRNCCLST